jgi:hypothetical protein
METPLWASQRIANAFERRFKRRPSQREHQLLEHLYLEKTVHRRPMTAMGATLAMIGKMTAQELIAAGERAAQRADDDRPIRVPLDPDLVWDGYVLTESISQNKAVLRAVRRHGDRIFIFPGYGHPNGTWLTATDQQVVLIEALAEEDIPARPKALLLPYSHAALRGLCPWYQLPDHGSIE